ncbi:imidazolonepropionase [Silanimonas sp.]|uniref:imidazolonepropionase n=1 Tax=Silanimonas sp. TaxID=1929290 RepID=UPI001BB86476|nr:imidazolonepropionase [Silanimonas sp.]MBS3895690.1 imidazolonepropionase [Silanimonas sp.]MBS3924391.1 imidazolonepropionase [Xanthomonadaceae bacterium]
MPSPAFLLRHLRLVTLDGPDAYAVREDGVLAVREGRIVFAGAASALPADCHGLEPIDGQQQLLTPGLIDGHTHLVFAGDRAGEFEQRLQGASYEDIARAGGGILSTVRATRAASEDALFAESLPRARALVASGCTTLEIKSGYGLTLADEAKMLRVARRIGESLGITVRTTYLAAHALPPEFAGHTEDYIDAVIAWLPILQAEGLVDAVDAFCERIAFSAEQTRRLFEAARALGLPVKLHADQLSDGGGAALVAGFGGLSADHVEHTQEAAVAAMAAAGTVAMLLPGSFHCLRETQRPPIEAFRRHGVPMAVSTDLNPGTSPLRSLPLAMSLACTHFRLTPEEALRGASQHAAKALSLADRGRIAPGLRADLALWPLRHPAELCYWLGAVRPSALWAEGHALALGST